MDQILSDRAKFRSSTSAEQGRIQKIHKFIVESNEINLKNSERITDQNRAIEELKESVLYKTNKLAVEQQKLLHSANELENQLDKTEELIDELEALRSENNTFDLKIKELKRIKPNPKDQQILDLTRKKLKLYRDLTGVVWNSQVIDSSTSGFITDWQEYMESFCLAKNEKKIEVKLWSKISKRFNSLKSPNHR